MRQFSYILLAAVVLQLSGARNLCGPRPASDHDCCSTGGAQAATSPLPECCVVSVARFESSIAEMRQHNHVVTVAPEVRDRATDILPQPTSNPLLRQALSTPISPPLTPLDQTCLLLI